MKGMYPTSDREVSRRPDREARSWRMLACRSIQAGKQSIENDF